ncbi:hypothetical protein ACSSS7_001832 [Eimeria intestinalis]
MEAAILRETRVDACTMTTASTPPAEIDEALAAARAVSAAVEAASATAAAAAAAAAADALRNEDGFSLDAALGLAEEPLEALEEPEADDLSTEEQQQQQQEQQDRPQQLLTVPPQLASPLKDGSAVGGEAASTIRSSSRSPSVFKSEPLSAAATEAPAAAKARRKARLACVKRAQNLEKIWLCGWAAWLRGLNSFVVEGRSSSKDSNTDCCCTPLLQGACLASFIAYCHKAQQPQQQHQLVAGRQRSRRVLLQRLQQLREEQLEALAPFSEASAVSPAAAAAPAAHTGSEDAVGKLGRELKTAAAPSVACGVPAAASAVLRTATEDYCIPTDGRAAYCFLASFEALQEGRLMHPFFCDSVPHAAAAAAAAAAVKRAQRAQQQQQEQRVAVAAAAGELPQHELAAAASAPEAAAAAALSSLRSRANEQHQWQQRRRQQHDRQKQEGSQQQTQQDSVKPEAPRGGSSSTSSSSGVALLNPRLPLAESRRFPFPYGFAGVLKKALRAVEAQQAPSALLAVVGWPLYCFCCKCCHCCWCCSCCCWPCFRDGSRHQCRCFRELQQELRQPLQQLQRPRKHPSWAAAVAAAAVSIDGFVVLQVCFAAGESACQSPPPIGLTRLFQSAGVPIPPYAAAAAGASTSAAAPAGGRLAARTQASKQKARASGPVFEQQQLLAACPYDSLFSFAASEAAEAGDAAAAVATTAAAPGTAARERSSKTRLLPHRRQALASDDASAAEGGAWAAPSALTNQPLPPLSRSELLQLLQLPAPLEVWGEFFCGREKRWVACVFKGPADSIFDAADVLSGRKGATMSAAAAAAAAESKPAAAAAAAQDVLSLQFLRCCCAVEQQKLEELQQRQQQLLQQQSLQKQREDEAAAAAQRAQVLTSGLLLNFKAPRRRLGSLGSSSSSSSESEGSSDASGERRCCSVAEAPSASVSKDITSAIRAGEAAHAAAAATVSPVTRLPGKDLRWPRYWEAKPWGLLFLSPNHLSLFVLPEHHQQQQEQDALRHPLLRMLLWRLQAKLVDPPDALQQLMGALTDALENESCVRDDQPSFSNSNSSSNSSERQAAPHERAEEAALIADAFAAAWKQSSASSSGSRKRGRAAIQDTGTIASPRSNSTSSDSIKRGATAVSSGGQELLGADFLQARRQRKGGLLQQGQMMLQRQQVQHQQQQHQQLQRAHPSASGLNPAFAANGAAMVVKMKTHGYAEKPVSNSNKQRSCPELQQRQQQQQRLFALEQQGRAAVRFVLAVEASGALKDVTHRYVSRQVSPATSWRLFEAAAYKLVESQRLFQFFHFVLSA